MSARIIRPAFLVALALLFTVGLTFATVELPRLVDGFLQNRVSTPGFDSAADEVSRLKTDLFIAHYHLRAVGYACFGAVLALIAVGFLTRRSELAMLGGLAFMLPVFAQFASVMFFLAGLGLLNVLWLPVLDLSFRTSDLGAVIRAPHDGLRWLLRLLGVNGPWPLIYGFIGVGLLLFFVGTFAWLRARARGQSVADFWVYRLSRHPQYLGWILWSYGLFLMLLLGRYPRRSWGISGSLPWLLATMVIVGVAMLEELEMRKRFGEEYEAYRRSAPFLFPVPAVVAHLCALPYRWLFRKERPDRRREVAAVLSLYTVVLMAASFLTYGGGITRIRAALRSEAAQQAHIAALVDRIRQEPGGRWADRRITELAAFGEAARAPLLTLLQDDNPAVRGLAARAFSDRPDPAALPFLLAGVADPSEHVRAPASGALAAYGPEVAVEPLLPLLDDTVLYIRIGVLGTLAGFGVREVLATAFDLLKSPHAWVRAAAASALGTLGSDEAVLALTGCLWDEDAAVRRDAVVALLRIGSPRARPALEAARRDEDREVRLYAAEAVKRMRRES